MKWHKNIRRRITNFFGIRVPNENKRMKVQKNDSIDNYVSDNVKTNSSETFQDKSHNEVYQANSAANSLITKASNSNKTGSCYIEFPSNQNRPKPEKTSKDDYPDKLNPFSNNYNMKNVDNYPKEFNPFEFDGNDDDDDNANVVHHDLNDEFKNNSVSEKSEEEINIIPRKNTTIKSYDNSQTNSVSNSSVIETCANIQAESCSVKFFNNQDVPELKKIKKDECADIFNPFSTDCDEKNTDEYPAEVISFEVDDNDEDDDETLVQLELKNDYFISEIFGENISITFQEENRIKSFDNSQSNSASKCSVIEISANIETEQCNVNILNNENISKPINEDDYPDIFNPFTADYNKNLREINPIESDKCAACVENPPTTCSAENKMRQVGNSTIKSSTNKTKQQIKQIRKKRRAPEPPVVKQIIHTDILSQFPASFPVKSQDEIANEKKVRKSQIKYSGNSANEFLKHPVKITQIQKHSSENNVSSKIIGSSTITSSSSLRYSHSDPFLPACGKELNSLISENKSQLQNIPRKIYRKAPPPPISRTSLQETPKKVKRRAPPPPPPQAISKQIKRQAPPPPLPKPKTTRMLRFGNFFKKIFKH